MLRRADFGDLMSIQAVLNAPDNLGKLEGYTDELVLAAISEKSAAVFVWEEDGQWGGFCWLKKTVEGTKVEEFGVRLPGRGVGQRFFAAVLEQVVLEGFPTPVWLNVAADNVGAIQFYERFGFVGTTLKKAAWKRRAGPIADALTMQLEPSLPPLHLAGDQNMA